SACDSSLTSERRFVLSVGEGRKLKVVNENGVVVKTQDVPLLDSTVRVKVTDKQVRFKLTSGSATEVDACADRMTIEGERRVVLQRHVRLNYGSDNPDGANKVVADRVILRLNKERIESMTVVPVEP